MATSKATGITPTLKGATPEGGATIQHNTEATPEATRGGMPGGGEQQEEEEEGECNYY